MNFLVIQLHPESSYFLSQVSKYYLQQASPCEICGGQSFFSEYFGFPFSVSFLQCSKLILSSTTDDIMSYQLTTSLNTRKEIYTVPYHTGRNFKVSAIVLQLRRSNVLRLQQGENQRTLGKTFSCMWTCTNL
jgi:hypothetical protein